MSTQLKVQAIKIPEEKKCTTGMKMYESIVSGTSNDILKRIFDVFGTKLNFPYKDINEFREDLFLHSIGQYKSDIVNILKIFKDNKSKVKGINDWVIDDFYDRYSKEGFNFFINNFLLDLKKGTFDDFIENKLKDKIFKVTYEQISGELMVILEELKIPFEENNLEDIYNGLYYNFKREEERKYFNNNFKNLKSDEERINLIQNLIFLFQNNGLYESDLNNLLKFLQSFNDFDNLIKFLYNNKINLSHYGIDDDFGKKIQEIFIEKTRNNPFYHLGNLNYFKENIEYLTVGGFVWDFIIWHNKKIDNNELLILLKDKNFVEKISENDLENIIGNLFSKKEKKDLCLFLLNNSIHKESESFYNLHINN